MDIGRHGGGIAADVEMRAFVKPGVEVGRLLQQPMLYIGFHALVARKGDVHAGEGAGLEMLLPLGLIEEVAAEVALAEEQPGAPAGAPRLPLLQEGTVRRHACAGADQDRKSTRLNSSH